MKKNHYLVFNGKKMINRVLKGVPIIAKVNLLGATKEHHLIQYSAGNEDKLERNSLEHSIELGFKYAQSKALNNLNMLKAQHKEEFDFLRKKYSTIFKEFNRVIENLKVKESCSD